MIIKYYTKRDINGNRYYIGLDTDRKVFARTPSEFIPSNFIEVKQREYRMVLETARENGFEEWYTMEEKTV